MQNVFVILGEKIWRNWGSENSKRISSNLEIRNYVSTGGGLIETFEIVGNNNK